MAREWDRVWNDGRMIVGGDRDNFLSVRMYYCRGGMLGDRGYYLSVHPVRRVHRFGYALLESCPSDGKRVLLRTVNRRSAKADKNASDIAHSVLNSLVAEVCAKNGIDPADLSDMIED